MARIDINGNEIPDLESRDDDYGQPRIHPPGTPDATGSPNRQQEVTPLPNLSDIFGKYGVQPGETDAANLAAKAPEDRAKFLQDLEAQAQRRAAPTSHREFDSQSGAYDTYTHQLTNPQAGMAARAFGGQWNPRAGLDMPGFQFDDPYSQLYEQTVRRQLDRLTGPNAEMDRLMQLIAKQLEGLQSPGYSPEEMALLNTQAFEPIEDLRGQAQKNVLQRASARGILPSSGIVEDEAQDQDRFYDKLRTVANRDLSINALNKRDADEIRALQIAKLGMDVPNAMGQQSLDVANLLYQMPRNSMMDSLAVLNASSPQNSIGSLLQLLQMQQNQSNYNQQQTSQLWANIGQILAGL